MRATAEQILIFVSPDLLGFRGFVLRFSRLYSKGVLNMWVVFVQT